MKNAFTLLELIIVIIIVGILAVLGLNEYSKVVDRKARSAEAKSILGAIQKAQRGYQLEKSAWATSFADLGLNNVPTSCVSTHYFRYSISTDGTFAYRCASGGKPPDSSTYDGHCRTNSSYTSVWCGKWISGTGWVEYW